MCYGCWKEAGAPLVVNDSTVAAAKLIQELYDDWGQAVGGPWHIFSDDWNVEDEDVQFCIEQSRNPEFWAIKRDDNPEGLMSHCQKIGDAVKSMTIEERYSALAMWEGFPQNYA